MPPAPVEVHQKGKPWPGYFLVRNTGEVVPLVAVDELPPSIEIDGVPRSLDLEETIGMLNLGLQRSTGSYYRIVQTMEGKALVSEALGKAKKTPDTSSRPSSPAKTPQGSVNASSSSTISSAQKGPTKPSVARTSTSSAASPTAIQLCRHWCTYGMCKWGQQCRYRHIMPMTLHGLQEVGLSDWPIWFRNENPGYFVSDSRGEGVPSRIGRGRRVVGNAGACCGPLPLANAGGARDDRLRGHGRVAIRERVNSRVLKSEELGEHIIARLRGMSKEGKVIGEKAVGVKVAGGGGGGNAMIERAAARDTMKWEDESEDDPDEREDKAAASGKLVDV